MKEENLIAYFPFDDPDGGGKAYDYSKSRLDAVMTGDACFSRNAVEGKSFMSNTGNAQTTRQIPLSSDFTLAMYLCPVSARLGWLLNFSGIDDYTEQWIDVVPEKWIFLVFQKERMTFRVYKDLELIYELNLTETPVGFSINDENLISTKALIDEVRLFNAAIPISELASDDAKDSKTDVEYYIDGRNFKDFGVYVSKSNGLVGYLERKEGATAEYDTYHGKAVNHDYMKYKERTITLECFIETSSRQAFIDWMNLFLDQFRKKGTRRLKVEYNGSTKPLVYEVVMNQPVDPEKTFGRYNETVMVGTFTLILEEDDPVKKVLRHIGTAANSVSTITFTSAKKLAIFWGDGTVTWGVRGTNKTITHTYTDPGSYEIIVAGNVEDIESFTTNDIVVWQQLM
jgi:hypothetical protein